MFCSHLLTLCSQWPTLDTNMEGSVSNCFFMYSEKYISLTVNTNKLHVLFIVFLSNLFFKSNAAIFAARRNTGPAWDNYWWHNVFVTSMPNKPDSIMLSASLWPKPCSIAAEWQTRVPGVFLVLQGDSRRWEAGLGASRSWVLSPLPLMRVCAP